MQAAFKSGLLASDAHDPALKQSEEYACALTMGCMQAKLTGILAASKATAERLQKESAQLHDRGAKLQADLDEQLHQNTALLADNGQRQVCLPTLPDTF